MYFPKEYKECRLCPRMCGVDRRTVRGFCGAGTELKVARAALHLWEEPCISGKNGSGTIFFSYCNLKCVYCQNYPLSEEGFGKEISGDRLRRIYFELIEKGAHNINLVTPTHYLPGILPTLGDLPVPVIMNCGGYELPETLELCRDRIDIYIPDMKYGVGETATNYSHAADYPERALTAIRCMIEQVGPPVFDKEGMLKRGVIIRHMVLPNAIRNTLRVLELLEERLPADSFLFSLMSQYTPCGQALSIPRIARPLRSSEYDRVMKKLSQTNITNGYSQELTSAQTVYIPPFDLEGV